MNRDSINVTLINILFSETINRISILVKHDYQHYKSYTFVHFKSNIKTNPRDICCYSTTSDGWYLALINFLSTFDCSLNIHLHKCCINFKRLAVFASKIYRIDCQNLTYCHWNAVSKKYLMIPIMVWQCLIFK